MIDENFLKILCCPETKQPLRTAPPDLISKMNSLIRKGELRDRSGKPVAEAIDDGLVREDGKWVYPVRGEIPVLLIDEALPL